MGFDLIEDFSSVQGGLRSKEVKKGSCSTWLLLTGLTMESIVSTKGKEHRTYQGFTYRLANTTQTGVQRWRCVKHTCGGVIYIANNEVMEGGKQHSHPGDQVDVEIRVNMIILS